MKFKRWALFVSVLFLGCNNQLQEKKLFELIEPGVSKIDFSNTLTYTEEVNPYTFRNFFNGGGVGLADFNNDGLTDIYLCGNQVSNKLYLNQGNFKFQDVTKDAGLLTDNCWTTGVSICDINSDGFQDIYICKSGPPGGPRRNNELFINNGNLTFTEAAKEYGLDFIGLSTHGAFFDFDKDGDLDCYLLNNSIRSVGGYDLIRDLRLIPDSIGGNKLLKNDGGKFIDVSHEAGIYTSAIGFGLGVTIGDLNNDSWEDIYVSNDFFERDYLYINNHDGTFTESLENYLTEISMGSMGADVADINNDGMPEIFVTEMLPNSNERLKTTAQFENWDRYQFSVKNGYYHQFGRNVLQLNNGFGSNGQTTFSEISRYAGVEASDWSWGALIFDMDNDGLKDIYVSNGIYKDLLDQDYINFIANQDAVRSILRSKGNVIKQLVDSIPSHKISNFAFKNINDSKFVNKAKEWGLEIPSHSNGSAYGDLDNDGDLDLVINNVNENAFLFKNNSNELLGNHWIQFKLNGIGKNMDAIGAKVYVYSNGSSFFLENNPMRGFESTVEKKLTIGLGKLSTIDSVYIIWPDTKTTIIEAPTIDKLLTVSQKDASDMRKVNSKVSNSILTESHQLTIPFKHKENEYVDFDRERLLFNMISNEGPCLCKGDLNSDGLEDIYVGGAKNQSGKLLIQTANGKFKSINESLFDQDKDSEDTDCAFFDANGDGRLDLYVTSGGTEYSSSSFALVDRLYLNTDGNKMTRDKQQLPITNDFISTSVVRPMDFDEDGDIDLFIGGRVKPGFYGVPESGYLLINDGHGNFKRETDLAPGLENVGLITDAQWLDINGDNHEDLVVVGEWMPISVFISEKGNFVDRTKALGFEFSNGWYHSLIVNDFNNDGKPDLAVGNFGLNSRFEANQKEPLTMYVNDFDRNGSVEQIINYYYDHQSYPLVMRNELTQQIPSLKKKILRFSAYKNLQIENIFSGGELSNSMIRYVYTFESAVWINRDSVFEKKTLPYPAQFSPVYSIISKDFDNDGNQDLLQGGNLCRAKPETGIYNASLGLLLKGNGNGEFISMSQEKSGIAVKGEIRKFISLKNKKGNYILTALNNDSIRVFKYEAH